MQEEPCATEIGIIRPERHIHFEFIAELHY
jgi:hypothetical protein